METMEIELGKLQEEKEKIQFIFDHFKPHLNDCGLIKLRDKITKLNKMIDKFGKKYKIK